MRQLSLNLLVVRLLEKERKPWPLLFHVLKLGFCHLLDALHVLEVGVGCVNTPKDAPTRACAKPTRSD